MADDLDVLQWLDDNGNLVETGPTSRKRRRSSPFVARKRTAAEARAADEQVPFDNDRDRMARTNAVIRSELDSWLRSYQPPFDPLTHQYKVSGDGERPTLVVERERDEVLRDIDRRSRRALDEAASNVRRMREICTRLSDHVRWTDADAVAYAALHERMERMREAGFANHDHNWSNVLNRRELQLHHRREAASVLSREYKTLAQRNKELAERCDHFNAIRCRLQS